jgi:hypothetical protein
MGRDAASAVGMEEAPVTLDQSVAGISQSVSRMPPVNNYQRTSLKATWLYRLILQLARRLAACFCPLMAKLMVGRNVVHFYNTHGRAMERSIRIHHSLNCLRKFTC